MDKNYNTERDPLVMAEYGRNIQNMVNFAMTLEDDEERNIAANAIITVMGQVNPMLRDREEFESKLWVHLYIISGYRLKVNYPCELPTREEVEKKPNKLAYPQSQIPYRYYGKTVLLLIEQILQIHDEEEQKKQILGLANLMKRQYHTYNHESVDDKIIRLHLLELSKGRLVLGEEKLTERSAKPAMTNQLRKKQFFKKYQKNQSNQFDKKS